MTAQRGQQLTKSEQISHALVALPIAHVLGSALFLWSYCRGFGAGLVVHASISDIVSVSISDMVFAYFIALVLPLLGVVLRYSTGKPYWNSGLELSEPSSPEFTRASRSRYVVLILIWTLIVSAVVAAVAVYLTTDEPSFAIIRMCAVFGAIILLAKLSQAFELSNRTFETLAVISIFAVSLVLLGLEKGYGDRHAKYGKLNGHYTSCGDQLILRRFGDRYLVALPNDSKAISSSDCKIVFGIPQLR